MPAYRYRRKARPAARRKASTTRPRRRRTVAKGRITQWPGRAQKAIRSWPDAIRVKLVYSFVLDVSGTPSVYKIIRGNSLYDPDYSVGGGQPQGFAQWSGLYSKYKVSGSSIRVQPVVANASNLAAASAWTIAPVLNDSPHYAETLSMFPYARNKVQQNVYTGSKGMSSYISTRKICGHSTADSDFEASTSSNPAKEWYWNFAFTAVDGATNLDFFAVVTVTYYATMFNRLTPV